jgi:hypothetical protein
MVRRGERCDCGARLRLIEHEGVPVGAAPPPTNGASRPAGPRRFARD